LKNIEHDKIYHSVKWYHISFFYFFRHKMSLLTRYLHAFVTVNNQQRPLSRYRVLSYLTKCS